MFIDVDCEIGWLISDWQGLNLYVKDVDCDIYIYTLIYINCYDYWVDMKVWLLYMMNDMNCYDLWKCDCYT